MSQHRQRTQPGPSLAPIIAGIVATLVILALNVWIIWDFWSRPFTWREVAGSLCASALGTIVAMRTGALVVERQAELDREEVAVRGLALGLEDSTPDPEADTTPQEIPEDYDPGPTRLNPRGWPEPIDGEPRPAWPEMSGDGQLQPLGTTREQTQRLTPPRTGTQVHGPSAAALRPIPVPQFRNEYERAVWAVEHNVPTEVLPRPERTACDIDEGWCFTHHRYES